MARQTRYHAGKLQGNDYEVWQQATLGEDDALMFDYFYRLGTEGDLLPVPEEHNKSDLAKKFAYSALKESIGHISAESKPTGIRNDGTLTRREQLRLELLYERDGSKELKDKLAANAKLVKKLAKERAAVKAAAAAEANSGDGS